MATPDTTAVGIRSSRAPARPGAPARRGAAAPARGRVQILLAADLLALGAATALTYGLVELLDPPAVSGSPRVAVPLIAAMWLGWLGIFAAYRLYARETRTIGTTSFDEVGSVFHALLAGNLAYLLGAQLLQPHTGLRLYTPLEAVMFALVAGPLVPLARGAARSWVRPAAARRRTLVVGSGEQSRRVQRKIASHPEYGLDLLGAVEPEELCEAVDALGADWVIVAAPHDRHEETLAAVREVRRPDLRVSIVPTYAELFAANAVLDDLEGMPLVSLPVTGMSGPSRVVKRAVDVAAAGLGLLLLSPVLLLIAVVVRLEGPGPVLFRQRRRGRGGCTFEILKFRTMHQDAEARRHELAARSDVDGPLFKMRTDPRITRPGRLLRRWSLDELPQLWNVLRGDMSLVGPRPFVVHEADEITGWAARRVDLPPGITGLWQVSGRNDLPFEEMVKLDYVYVTNWSLWWDLRILCQTVPVVLGRRGAY